MNCLVVGYGSIGQRHVRVLRQLGCRVAVVSRRQISVPLTYPCLAGALAKERPEYVILANETKRHFPSLVQLADYAFQGTVLIEKPLFDSVCEIPANSFKQAYVGYNLRFHPILQRVLALVRKERTLYAQVYVGQYLPAWRPGRDYRATYSAKKDEGGGVLLDLSHDLDYLLWFFRDWHKMAALGGKYSSLAIDSEDMYSLMLGMNTCPVVQVHINYLDRISRREVTVVTENYAIKADLVRQTLRINDKLLKYRLDRDYTYLMQHRAIINGTHHCLCSLAEGLKVLAMVNAAKQSAQQGKWLCR